MLKKIRNLVIFIFFLETLIFFSKIPTYILPAPHLIIANLFSNFTYLFSQTLYTLFEAILGLLIVIVLGIFLAILIDLNPTFKKILMPIIYTFQLIPAIVLAPLLLIWFGFGNLSIILLIIIMCIFPVITSTYSGLQSVDLDLIFLFQQMNASTYQIYIMLKLPSATKFIFSGLKIAITYSITSALLAEFIGAQNGLGVSLANSLKSFNTINVFTIIFITASLTILLLKLLQICEKRFLKYEKNI